MFPRATIGLGHTLKRCQRLPTNTRLAQSISTTALSRSFMPSRPLSNRSPISRLLASPQSSLSISKRLISSSPPSAIRDRYYKRSSGGYYGGGNGGGSNWWSRVKQRLDRIPPMTLVYALIGINGGVYLLWQYALQSAQRFRDPTLLYFLRNNFILNEANVFAGRIWTLVTSAFSHSSGTHILVNCLGLYFVAPAAAGLLGTANFLGLYLGAGAFSSLVSLGYHRMSKHQWWGSEGASGAIYACLAYYGAMFPQSTVLMFFIVPMPVWLAISGMFAWDFYGALFRPNSGTDSAGHIGGIMYGLLGALATRRGGVLRMFQGGSRRRW
ncbi:hypothetical protein I350_05745 [Cryptococcus amylolentus CBS 6273]|uniref:Peptidase S54 rhomboid domain-containing protein n=1 Tax=Cryptococcus amylolentus CBS 6273 TaxID=1296118 RepID=A0A1E3JQ11_9TREE|nr:hypothetical protein I350_05745 [Cryptococcus amylolentus CBS 6273]